jgi:hypothetical protein
MQHRATWYVTVGGVVLFGIGRLAEFTVAEAGRVAPEAAGVVSGSGEPLFHAVVAGVLGNAVYNSLFGPTVAPANHLDTQGADFRGSGLSTFGTNGGTTNFGSVGRDLALSPVWTPSTPGTAQR